MSDEEWAATAEVIDEVALECLDFLVDKGCDRSFLIACLRAIAWAELPRLSKVEVRQAVQDLRKAAELTRRLGGSDLGTRIREAFPGAMLDLETDLDGLAQAVEKNVSLADRRAARTRDDCMAALVRHVEERVKLSRDNEVAAMVSGAPKIEAALWREVMGKASSTGRRKTANHAAVAPRRRRSRYSEAAHAKWRERHLDLLKEETVFEREWRAKQERAAKRRAFWEATWVQPLPTPELVQAVLKQLVEAVPDGLKET